MQKGSLTFDKRPGSRPAHASAQSVHHLCCSHLDPSHLVDLVQQGLKPWPV